MSPTSKGASNVIGRLVQCTKFSYGFVIALITINIWYCVVTWFWVQNIRTSFAHAYMCKYPRCSYKLKPLKLKLINFMVYIFSKCSSDSFPIFSYKNCIIFQIYVLVWFNEVIKLCYLYNFVVTYTLPNLIFYEFKY